MKIHIDNKVVSAIAKEIKGTEYEGNVYLVGGYVRDLIMCRQSDDIDLLVDGDIDAGIKFAKWFCERKNIYKSGSNPVEYGLYGVAMLHFMNEKIECVAPRSEKYKDDSRNPIVESCTLEEDCYRRDFTINSMFINISTNELLDLSGNGLEDINNKVIRSTSDPNIIFKEDPLRLLRCIRFASRFNWDIEKNTWFGLLNNADRIKIVSQERISAELDKMLVCDYPSKAINSLLYCNLLDKILPDIYNLIKVTQNKYHFGDAFVHTMSVLDNTKPILENRLSALFHDVGKLETRTETNGEVHFYCHEDVGALMAEQILKKMKYSNDIVAKVKLAVKNHMRLKSIGGDRVPSNKSLRKLQSDLGENIDLVLDVIHADNISHAKQYCMPNQVRLVKEKIEEVNKSGKSFTKIELPIDGSDILNKYNLKPTPLIGKLLDLVKEAYFDNPEITKEECFDLITKHLAV